MFLKSLTLKGFKSFAEATTLAMEPGVTVVVGPNGSGKSNVVDAIGWVLGAQAPSAVRSAKMDDVIFAGTAKRPALGRAEVSLTIDNSSGLLPIEFTEVTVTRTLFRSGDSEYALNGVPCRLLDVQELLSDTGLGRSQHVIISQGHIDAVLNARPEDRRLIIEEAAGVLKFRRRKEKAERRLTATEANLTRLEDLAREVRRQLRPLEKQADAARRHRGLEDELHALRVYLSGRDLQRLRGALAENTAEVRELRTTERTHKAALAELDSQVIQAESALVSAGGRDLAESFGRAESLREKARGLLALTAERRRRIERERTTEMDRQVIATLEAEAAAVAEELVEVTGEIEALGPATSDVEHAEAELAAAQADFEDRWPDAPEPAPSAAAEVRGRLAALSAAGERNEAEEERLSTRHSDLVARVARLDTEIEGLNDRITQAEGELGALEGSLKRAREDDERAAAAASAAEESRRAAEAAQAACAARVETLESALDAARARAGAEQLAGIPGVVGTLLDVVEVDEGYQAAFESGAGDAIAAVVMDGIQDARSALVHLRSAGGEGAVLALGHHSSARTDPVVESRGTTRLRSHVRGLRGDVDDLLDRLVGNVLVAPRWEDALAAALERPDVLVVTTAGDRFAASGWRVATSGAGATGGALSDARRRAALAAEAADDAQARADAASGDREATLQALRSAQEAVKGVAERLTTDRAMRSQLGTELVDRRNEVESSSRHLDELGEVLRRDAERSAELTVTLGELQRAESRAAEESRRRAEVLEDLQRRAERIARTRSQVEVRSAGLAERRELLERRAAEIAERLARSGADRVLAEDRRLGLERSAEVMARLHELVSRRLESLETILAELESGRQQERERLRSETEELERLRTDRSAMEETLEACRQKIQQTELSAAELRVRLEQVTESVRVDLDVDPAAALGAECPAVPEGMTPVSRVRDLERELRAMGTINPLALDEYEAMRERHEFLATQLDDVKSSRRELAKVIREVDAEIAGSFRSAYADVRTNFADLFTMLFPGGSGDLELTDPDHPLATGIEIKARPSGKNVRTLSLLSGGERSLVALAYLFAVFRSRSSPFYVMDEVEAALDDVNLHRFLDLVADFRDAAQLIIVSHQKRTMEAADALFGVTMQPGGSSKVVSERT